jgi:hypothetical protein
MEPRSLVRRRLLKTLLLVALWTTAPGAARAGARRRSAPPVPLRARDSAAVVGAEYLRRRPWEAGRATLRRLAGLGDPDGVAGVVARHLDDLRAGRVLRLAGWRLSLTELRLAALVALESAGAAPAHSSRRATCAPRAPGPVP